MYSVYSDDTNAYFWPETEVAVQEWKTPSMKEMVNIGERLNFSLSDHFPVKIQGTETGE